MELKMDSLFQTSVGITADNWERWCICCGIALKLIASGQK